MGGLWFDDAFTIAYKPLIFSTLWIFDSISFVNYAIL